MKTILFALMFSLVSCGESPLLNHDMEKSFNSLGKTNIATVADYQFKKAKVSFSVDWTQAPRVGESSLIIKTWKSNGSASGPYQDPEHQLHVLLWMPSMGHGSSPVRITKTAPGEYDVTNMYFIMGGTWEVKFQLLSGGKVVDETILSYNL